MGLLIISKEIATKRSCQRLLKHSMERIRMHWQNTPQSLNYSGNLFPLNPTWKSLSRRDSTSHHWGLLTSPPPSAAGSSPSELGATATWPSDAPQWPRSPGSGGRRRRRPTPSERPRHLPGRRPRGWTSGCPAALLWPSTEPPKEPKHRCETRAESP